MLYKYELLEYEKNITAKNSLLRKLAVGLMDSQSASYTTIISFVTVLFSCEVYQPSVTYNSIKYVGIAALN